MNSVNWTIAHKRAMGLIIFSFGVYLATLTGTTNQSLMSALGAIGSGAAAGAGAGVVTYLVLGTVGVATGGAGIALGLLAMSLIGASVGTVGASAASMFSRFFSYPLISPWVWAPVLILGVYILLISSKRENELH